METIIVKRYDNRKLYNTHEGKYITLMDVARYIQGNINVQVIKHSTNEDITVNTLNEVLHRVNKLDTLALINLIKGGVQ